MGNLYSYQSNGQSVEPSKAVTGHKWEYEIYFDPEAEVDYGDKYDIKEEDLMTTLKQLVGVDEVIINVWAYTAPPMEAESSPRLLFHMFVVFKTEGWWWSIEKHTDGITIQRSYFKTAVIDRYRRKNRKSGWEVLKEDIGKMSVHELIEWLYKKGEQKKT
ncbi:hypothetical protein DPMN_030086 [Dreissena polymorpha]|uniref:Uncharacterized protein n=1 Tax=Dreissena polymorpha TaxID=45954 RepID=A0A9D4LXJ9_DREPO|nr:hypothetical protein DPMN_030086 [Dreissena polymorpha]